MATTPSFLTKELFEKSLKGFYEDNNITILGYSSKAAVPVGDNYASELFRVNVTFRRNNSGVKMESISLIVKMQPIGNEIAELNKEMKLFTKEIEMFGKTLPMMYDILGPELKGSLSSLCLLTAMEPNPLLVLEDLQPAGFKMAPRRNGLDFDHCALAMRKIAMFHASSVVLVDKNPSTIKNYGTGIYSDHEMIAPWLLKGLNSFAQSLKSWPGMENYGIKLEKMGTDAVKRGVEAGDKRSGGFNVLNHGDLWINNMLFTYHDNGKLNDLKFVDFQIVKYTSPALDLHYFLGTSPSVEVRRKHMDSLLNIYYGHLIATLATLNYSLDTVPSRADFIKDFNSRAFYGILSLATVTPLVRSEQRNDATFEDLMKDDSSFRHHCYTNDSFKEYIMQVMPQYDYMGVFN